MKEKGIVFTLAFLNAVYDEYVLQTWSQESAFIDGKTCRALQQVIGPSSFSKLLKNLEKDDRIRLIVKLEELETNETEIAIEILDYVT